MATFIGLLLVLQASGAQAPAPAPASPWAAIQFLVGDWQGESEGKPGKGAVKRSYTFVLGDTFLHERNVSSYPPQPGNESGEIHHHWSLFSYDKARRSLVLRQFHQEGFVNQYVTVPTRLPNTVVFETEAIENIPLGWSARETYEAVSPDEFVETFELRSGTGPYEVYSKARFKRVGRR